MRKPLVVRSVRFTDEECALIDALAASVQIEPAVLIRRMTMKAVRAADAGALKAEVAAIQRAQEALFA